MNFKIYTLPILLFLFLSPVTVSQEKPRDSEQWIMPDNEMMYNIVIATDKDLKITKGLLYGIKGDSIYLNIRNQMVSLNLKDLISLAIEDRRENNNFLYGVFSGAYFGSLIFLTTRNISARYLEDPGTFAMILYEIGFGTIGGGIGYFINTKPKDSQVIFYFGKDGEGIEKEIDKLKSFLANKKAPGKLKFNFYMSQVLTRFSQIRDISEVNNNYANGYAYYDYDIHSFNLLRRASVTYEMFEKLEFGAAIGWFGEPPISLYIYNSNPPYSNGTTTINQTYEGTGYYIIINYKPLKDLLPEYFDFLAGGGIGLGKIDYNFTSNSSQYTDSGTVYDIKNTRINKLQFSALLTSEMKYNINPGLSFSLQADYIYLQGKMPAIAGLGLSERSLGSFSFGIGMGFNF